MDEIINQKETNLQKKSKAVLVFQIITAVLYLLFAFFMIYSFIDSVVLIEESNTKGLSIALYLVYIVIIIGGISSILLSLFSCLGLVVGLIKKKKGFLVSNGKIIYFIIFIALPILTILTIGIITKLMA